jgi:hypothetical protein
MPSSKNLPLKRHPPLPRCFPRKLQGFILFPLPALATWHKGLALEMAGGFGMAIDPDASFQWLITMFIANLGRPREEVMF